MEGTKTGYIYKTTYGLTMVDGVWTYVAMLNIVGNTLSGMTAYNEYITDVIIAVIVYLSAFSLVIRMWLTGRKKKEKAEPAKTGKEDTAKGGEDA